MRDTRLRRSVSQYLRDMRARNLCEDYVKTSRLLLLRFAGWMEDREVLSVSQVDSALLTEYLESTRRYSANYQALHWNAVCQFLKFHENTAILKFRWKPMGRDRNVQTVQLGR